MQRAAYDGIKHRFVEATTELMWREYDRAHGREPMPHVNEGPRGHEEQKSARERRLQLNREHAPR